jgi:phosphoglycerol transferase MdoB-like AlkP superfamily enzyme
MYRGNVCPRETVSVLSRLRVVWDLAKQRYMWVLAALLLTLFIESVSRGNWVETLTWSVTHLPLLLLNAALVACLLALATLPTGHLRVAFWVVGAVTLVFGAVSGVKLKLMGRPFLPEDLAIAGEAVDVVNWGDVFSLSLVLGLVLFVVLGAVLLHKVEVLPRKVGWKERSILAGVAAVVMGILFLAPPGAAARVMAGEGAPWDQAHHVRTDGFLLSLADNVRFMMGGTGVSKPAIANVSDFLRTEPEPHTPAVPAEARKPNVVVVLSESLFDPTTLPGAKFSQDPLPFFHSLQANYPSGTLLSPEFAGGTANVELEVLTGLSMKFLPDGVLAYEKHISRPVDSLASIFAREGYPTTAISPWASWFFNSKNVYRNFGFDKFISIDFMKQEYNSPYLADHEVARNVIEESRKTPGPDFIFANTAENHYNYGLGKFSKMEIEVTGLSAESNGTVATYAQGCLYADRMLQQLVSHFEASGEPTLIVFFGDHLPLLGKNYGIYKEAGYLQENDPEFVNKIYHTPVVTWNNYLPKEKKDFAFGAQFLGPYILEQANVPGTPVTKYLQDLSTRVKEVPARRFWDAWQIPAADMQQYEALQFDILQGEQKAYEGFKDRIVRTEFVLGLGKMTVEQVVRENGGTGARVQGRHFPPTGTVLINGKRVPTTWESEQSYLVQVPVELAAAAEWEVEVKVFDLQYPEEAVAETGKVKVAVDARGSSAPAQPVRRRSGPQP